MPIFIFLLDYFCIDTYYTVEALKPKMMMIQAGRVFDGFCCCLKTLRRATSNSVVSLMKGLNYNYSNRVTSKLFTFGKKYLKSRWFLNLSC